MRDGKTKRKKSKAKKSKSKKKKAKLKKRKEKKKKKEKLKKSKAAVVLSAPPAEKVPSYLELWQSDEGAAELGPGGTLQDFALIA